MVFKNSWTGNWEGAFRGLRHPMESYSKSDSTFGIIHTDGLLDLSKRKDIIRFDKEFQDAAELVRLGPNDLDLAQRMIKAGTPNDKFLRQIFVSVDITAPLYWWKEADTYKVGTTADSTSTMHKLATTSITMECFEMDDYDGSLKMYDREPYNIDEYTADMWDNIICYCETLRKRYLETKDIRYWKELIRVLPEGWLQTRQWTANYAVLRNIYHWRKDHRLTEWHTFCDWIRTLPYANELLLFEN